METRSAGARIHFEVHGEGPPVLLVHGYPLSGRLWDGILPQLSADFRLIVPDLRGFGRSEATASATMDDYADDLRAVLVAADEDRPVVLVGMSMGGYVCLAFCRRHRERVRGLALVDSRATPDSVEAAEARHRTAERVVREGSAFVADEMVAGLFASGAPADLRERWRKRMASASPQGVAAALRAMAARPGSEELLRDLDLPLLVMVGAEDAITPVEGARAMAQLGAGTLEIIPGAGHMAAAEKPEIVAGALRRFLAEMDGER